MEGAYYFSSRINYDATTQDPLSPSFMIRQLLSEHARVSHLRTHMCLSWPLISSASALLRDWVHLFSQSLLKFFYWKTVWYGYKKKIIDSGGWCSSIHKGILGGRYLDWHLLLCCYGVSSTWAAERLNEPTRCKPLLAFAAYSIAFGW